jgi:prepilin-type N-terminal cleavage/methylation domain-containing protein
MAVKVWIYKNIHIRNYIYIIGNGFTLIELLIVMSLLATLSVMAYPRMIDFNHIQNKMTRTKVEKQMQGARLASMLTGCDVLWEQGPGRIFYQLLSPCEPLKIDVDIENEKEIDTKSVIFHVVGTCANQKAIQNEEADNQKKRLYFGRGDTRNISHEHYTDCAI